MTTMLYLSILTPLLLTFTNVVAFPAGDKSNTANITNPQHCVSGNFDEPWVLHDIFVWEPFRTSSNSNVTERGYINFIFCDPNNGLRLDTVCSGDLINGVTKDKNGGYNLCRNSSVAFKYTKQGEILMERAYIDPCLGPPPWDGGIAFGQNTTAMVKETAAGFGRTWKQAEMLVLITEQT